jgi:hypothetical protein
MSTPAIKVLATKEPSEGLTSMSFQVPNQFRFRHIVLCCHRVIDSLCGNPFDLRGFQVFVLRRAYSTSTVEAHSTASCRLSGILLWLLFLAS